MFTELRQLANDGIISYPYSLRELVSIVKHLNKFPNDSLAEVVRNVFDFDNYNNDFLDRLRSILHRNGIPFQIPTRTIQLATSSPFKITPKHELWPIKEIGGIETERASSIEFQPKIKTNSIRNISSIDRTDSRTKQFSELNSQYRLPVDQTTFVHDMNILQKEDRLLILTANPLSLWHFRLGENQAKKIDLNNIFQANTNRFLVPNYQVNSCNLSINQ